MTYEIGTRFQREDLQFAASVYYTDIDSVIMRIPETPGGSDYVNTNAQDGKVYGVEAQLAYNLTDCWRLALQGSWQDGETRTPSHVGGPMTEDYISRVAPLMGSVSLRWIHPDKSFWIEGRVIAAETADKLSAGNLKDNQRIPSGGTPSYVIASLYAGWQATDDLSLTLGLENLTDEDYRVHGSGQNESGFNAILGAKYSF